jgi:hypothetical protein
MIKGVPGLTCEVGVRRGGGTYNILEALRENDDLRTHICIDPYGNIVYNDIAGSWRRDDYTNSMRNEVMPNLYSYASMHGLNIIFFNLEDSEYYDRFWDGVPIYEAEKQIINTYALAHIDGQHDLVSVMRAAVFFTSRIPSGGLIAFDNVNHYNHNSVHEYLILNQFEAIGEVCHKRVYKKI